MKTLTLLIDGREIVFRVQYVLTGIKGAGREYDSYSLIKSKYTRLTLKRYHYESDKYQLIQPESVHIANGQVIEFTCSHIQYNKARYALYDFNDQYKINFVRYEEK